MVDATLAILARIRGLNVVLRNHAIVAPGSVEDSRSIDWLTNRRWIVRTRLTDPGLGARFGSWRISRPGQVHGPAFRCPPSIHSAASRAYSSDSSSQAK